LKKTVLIVDDEAIVRNSLAECLANEGYKTLSAGDAEEAMELLNRNGADIAVLDVNLPGVSGMELLNSVKRASPSTGVVILTGYGTVEDAVQAMKRGADDYLVKPCSMEELKIVLGHIAGQQALRDENIELRRQLEKRYELENIIGRSFAMRKVFERIEAVSGSEANVLIEGETGTGKDLVARALHKRSPRREKAFVKVDCASLPETLLESELFGHVRGAFTGASADKEGKFAAANGGTIFLDEISSASPQLQLKLLRVIQERRFEPVGSNRTREVDVRVLLATNRDLAAEVKAGRFREDLYYRINVVSIELPPLRERAGDIPLLAKHFLEKYLEGTSKTTLGFSPEAMEAMHRHRWPGNVRELENCVERAVVLSRGIRIGLEDLPQAVREGAGGSATGMAGGAGGRALGQGKTLAEALVEPQRQIILGALKANRGNRKAAARQLGINRATLYKKMAKLRISD
jgi:DNA-binding NtrC family response regulator